MAVFISNTLHVARDAVDRGATYAISILDPAEPIPAIPLIPLEQRLILRFQDLDHDPDRLGIEPPSAAHVEAILHFVRHLPVHASLVVHCQAGISRSVAVAMIATVARGGTPADAEDMVRAQDPGARTFPNRRLAELADEIMGRAGGLTSAVDNLRARRFKRRLSAR